MLLSDGDWGVDGKDIDPNVTFEIQHCMQKTRKCGKGDGKGKQGKCFMVEFYIISKTLPSREFNFSVGLWMNYDVVLRETEKKKIKGNRVDNLF